MTTSSSPSAPTLPVAAWLALAVALLFWSSAFVAIRAALQGFSPGHLALLRFLTASAALVPLALWHRARAGSFPWPAWRDVPAVLWHGFLGFYAYHVLLNHGERTVSAASAAFLIGAIPVCSTFLAAWILKEPLHRRALAGLALSLVGVTVIALGEGDGPSLDTGALLVLGAAVAESVYFVAIKDRLRRHGSLPYTICTMWAGTLWMLVHAPGLGEAAAAAPPAAFWSVIYLGVCPAALGYVLWNFALSHGRVGWISSTQFAQPFLAMGIGALWLGEAPGWLAVGGGVLALLGAAVTTGMVGKRRG